MYKAFFGLNELPFSIAPNPQYLYMSDRHKEALAHLMFGLSETGGFVLLTGEVGTGKTTTSRCLLEQVPENTKVAFILNPTLTEHELLATVCDELAITYSDNATIKELTDNIRDFLLQNHEAKQNALLIIDEAQHLRPEVLEQLRLLTNLETNTKKLLQVILIGQPELQALLKRQELRQLAQRITARYHLLPLTVNEVAAYIVHRLNVAGCPRQLFTTKAIKRIHQLSGGIPRIINLLCDRALIGAYGQNKSQVDAKLINQAAVEALGAEEEVKPTLTAWFLNLNTAVRAALATITLISVLGLGWLLGQPESTPEQVSVEVSEPQNDKSQVVDDTTSELQQTVVNDIQVKSLTIDFEQARSFDTALNDLLAVWSIDATQLTDDICYQITDWQLGCYMLKGSLSSLLNLNYPALLELYDEQGNAFYAVLSTFVVDENSSQSSFNVLIGTEQFEVDRSWFDQYWRGSAIVLWQMPDDFQGSIKVESSNDQIQWLENTLAYALNTRPRVVTQFDGQLQRTLHKFQRANRLPLTPYADEETIIALFHKVNPDLPQLQVMQ